MRSMEAAVEFGCLCCWRTLVRGQGCTRVLGWEVITALPMAVTEYSSSFYLYITTALRNTHYLLVVRPELQGVHSQPCSWH